jgi:hypothetical protein
MEPGTGSLLRLNEYIAGRSFPPIALNPSAFLQAIEQWLEGGNIETNGAAGALLDEFGNLVTVSWTGLDETGSKAPH